MNKEIMVVKRDYLFNEHYFEGFLNKDIYDFEARILTNYKFMARNLAEKNPSYKQPICYIAIINPKLGKIFLYQRAFKGYKEERLKGKYSIGIGGHVEKIDKGNPLYASIVRELNEEVDIKGKINLKKIGYINYDSDDVSKVHFGLLYVAETDVNEIKARAEILEGKFIKFKEAEDLINSRNAESWTRISFEALKKIYF